MSIVFAFNCNECNHEFSDGEPVYCSDCYKELQNEVSRLENRIEDLERENESLRSEIDEQNQDIL